MNQWQNGQSDGMFNQQTPTHLNPAMFSNLNAAGQFDLNGASPFNQQALANGAQTTNPFGNAQTFQPGSVIPQKRQHDGGMSGSPPPQTNQTSRSQTPNFNAFANQQAGQAFPQGATPNPYNHLQQASSTQATPSPTMQSQPFRQPSRMSNASPSPFGPGQNNLMSSANQNMLQATSMGQGQMPGMGQYGMNTNTGMNNPMAAMTGQSNNMNAMMAQRRQYQMQLMQQQAALRQQQSGSQNMNRANASLAAMQVQGAPVQNGTLAAQQAQAQAQMKRTQFLGQCAAYAAKNNRQFNPAPMASGKAVDLYSLFTCVISGGGSGAIERNGQWASVANRLGFPPQQFPTAAEEIKGIFVNSIAAYEKVWMTAKASQKQEQARMHAQQMAGFGTGTQPQNNMQQNIQAQYQQRQQAFNQMQQSQQQTPQPQQQATPVQANATLPQNGVTTPQPMTGPGSLQHRRNSSMRKAEAMMPATAAPSPHAPVKVQNSPIVNELKPRKLKRDETDVEKQGDVYTPYVRPIQQFGGYNVGLLAQVGQSIANNMPVLPTSSEMGIIDTRAITLSLASGIHSEVRYALDTLTVITTESSAVNFELEKCEDLTDVLADCAEEQIDILADKADEVSDTVDLPSYEDVARHTRIETETLLDVPTVGTQAWELDRAADKVIAISTILRNLSFYEHNHRLLTSPTVIKWLSHTLRLLGTRHMFLRTYHNLQDFYKDIVIFLSNVTQSLELPGRDDALHILHFLLTFTPQPAPSYSSLHSKLIFTPFSPSIHRYLPPAVDCLAKLLTRQDPNRAFFKSIFSSSSNNGSEEVMDLLTKAFALAIAVIPDRNKTPAGTAMQLRIMEARRAYLTQGMLAADILTTLLPGGESEVAKAWVESDDGWPSSLLSLAEILSIDYGTKAHQPGRPPVQWDTETFVTITQRALSMLKRLAEKAGKGAAKRLLNGTVKMNGASQHDEDDDAELEQSLLSQRWDGVPERHFIIGALYMRQVDGPSLNLLCGLHELDAQS